MATGTIDTHLGRRLRLRRTSMGLSQTAVAEAVGISFQQVQKYERGANAMNATRLHEFSQALHVPVAYFFDGLEAPPAAPSPPVGANAQGTPSDEHRTAVSDREALEMMKAFGRITGQPLRQCLARLARIIADS